MVKMSLDKNVENRWLVLTHWLRVPERIKYRLAVLVYRCRNHTAPEYLARDLHWVADDDSRRRLRSSTTQQLSSVV